MLSKLSFSLRSNGVFRQFSVSTTDRAISRSSCLYDYLHLLSLDFISISNCTEINKFEPHLVVSQGSYIFQPKTFEHFLLFNECRNYFNSSSSYHIPIRLKRLIVKNNGPETLFRSVLKVDTESLFITTSKSVYNYLLLPSNKSVDMNQEMCVICPGSSLTIMVSMLPQKTYYIYDLTFDIHQ